MSNNFSRSWLVVPAHRPADVELAAHSGADVVVLDMVEFVADKDKLSTRIQIRAAIDKVRAGGPLVYVQTTHATHEEDLRAAACPALSGVVISRAESAAQVRDMHRYADTLAADALTFVIALETACGNQDAHDIITASKRVSAITLGRADLTMDLRPEPSGELHMMPYLMQRLVILAGAVGVTPLGAGWRAPDRGLYATADSTFAAGQRGRALGFKGALCVADHQVEPLNRAYA